MSYEKFPPIPGEASAAPLRFDRETMAVAEEALKKAGREVLGKGAESLVEVHPLDAEKVVAHSFRKEMRAEEILHAHRVLKILFPNHFPVIYEAYENTDEMRGGTVRERVRDTGRKIEKTKPRFLRKQKINEKTFDYVNKELEAMGIQGLHFDGETERNFIINEEGYQQYLDTVPFLARELVRSKDSVLAYMVRKGETRANQEAVKNAIETLETLISNRAY
jgi:hypothetical protein